MMVRSLMTRFFLGLSMTMVVLIGCGDDQVGIPQPDPIPHVSAIRTTGAMPGAKEEVDVLGLPGAVDGPGLVTVKGKLQTATTNASDAGSFVLTIKAELDEHLEVSYKSSDSVQVKVLQMPISTPPQPDLMHTGPPITQPVGGETTIIGKAALNAQLIGVNVDTGDSASSIANATTGQFVLTIKAETGHEIRVYGLGEPLTEPWTQIVP
jgi:hypothetical protein